MDRIEANEYAEGLKHDLATITDPDVQARYLRMSQSDLIYDEAEAALLQSFGDNLAAYTNSQLDQATAEPEVEEVFEAPHSAEEATPSLVIEKILTPEAKAAETWARELVDQYTQLPKTRPVKEKKVESRDRNFFAKRLYNANGEPLIFDPVSLLALQEAVYALPENVRHDRAAESILDGISKSVEAHYPQITPDLIADHLEFVLKDKEGGVHFSNMVVAAWITNKPQPGQSFPDRAADQAYYLADAAVTLLERGEFEAARRAVLLFCGGEGEPGSPHAIMPRFDKNDKIPGDYFAAVFRVGNAEQRTKVSRALLAMERIAHTIGLVGVDTDINTHWAAVLDSEQMKTLGPDVATVNGMSHHETHDLQEQAKYELAEYIGFMKEYHLAFALPDVFDFEQYKGNSLIQNALNTEDQLIIRLRETTAGMDYFQFFEPDARRLLDVADDADMYRTVCSLPYGLAIEMLNKHPAMPRDIMLIARKHGWDLQRIRDEYHQAPRDAIYYIDFEDKGVRYLGLVRPASVVDTFRGNKDCLILGSICLPEDIYATTPEVAEERREFVAANQRRYLNRRGVSIPVEHPEVRAFGYESVDFKKSAEHQGLIDVTIHHEGGDYNLTLGHDLRLGTLDKTELNIAAFERFLIGLLGDYLCQEAIESEEGAIGVGQSSVNARIPHLRMLPEGHNFSYDAWSHYVDEEGLDLVEKNIQLKAEHGTTRNFTYVRATESDDPELSPLVIKVDQTDL